MLALTLDKIGELLFYCQHGVKLEVELGRFDINRSDGELAGIGRA
jgi:hypothetical protein